MSIMATSRAKIQYSCLDDQPDVCPQMSIIREVELPAHRAVLYPTPTMDEFIPAEIWGHPSQLSLIMNEYIGLMV